MVTFSLALSGTGHQGGLIILTALFCCVKPIKSPPDEADGRYHLLPFLGEIISLASDPTDGGLLRQWPFRHPVVGCSISHGVKLPRIQNVQAGMGPKIPKLHKREADNDGKIFIPKSSHIEKV